MTISLTKVLEQVELEVNRAKQTTKTSEQRERLAAIKSLCELALADEVKNDVERQSFTTTAPKAPTFASNVVGQTPPQTIQTKPMAESDANGDSIFDF